MSESPEPASAAPSPSSPRRPLGIVRPRWWPLVLIVVGVAGFCLYIIGSEAALRQAKVMRIASAVFIGLVLVLLWLIFASRLSRRGRWLGLGAYVAALVLGKICFRFEGVTGDLIPILEPRWKARTSAQPVAVAGASSTTSSPSTSPAASPGSIPGQGAGPGFPQFLGPTRDGVIAGVVLQEDWVAHPPRLLWKQPVGQGWGGFAVVGERAITQEQDAGDEVVACYDLDSGRRLWAQRDAARYDNPIGGIGPRATPTVDGGRVYTFGSTGQLNCFELESGKRVWGTNVVGRVDAKELEWGASSSPLVLGDRVIVAPRGAGGVSLAAFRTDNGAHVWSGGGDDPHYSSPRLEVFQGVPQILTFTSAGVAAIRPENGAVLWEYAWPGGHPHVSDPRVIASNRVLISSGYGTGSRVVEVTPAPEGQRWKATNTVWRSIRLKSKFANLLVRDRFAYGLDDGKLVCVDLADGSLKWQGERYGHGQLLLVGNLILLTAESGAVVLVEATPEAFRERTRFAAVEGKTWNPPALSGDRLLVRNDREAAAYRLPLKP